MANRDILVFDFETGSKNPYKAQPTQLAAVGLDGRNLRVKCTFNSEIRPILDDEAAIAAGLDPLQEEALIKTGKTREKLALAPDLKSVWTKFIPFVNKLNWKGVPFFAPIPAGYNIIGYDMIIINRLCKQYGPWCDKEDRQLLVSKVFKIDLMDNMFMWTEGDPNIKNINMDEIRKLMGMKAEGAHEALQDVKDTANILIKMMLTHRAVYKNLNLEKAFADGQLYVK